MSIIRAITESYDSAKGRAKVTQATWRDLLKTCDPLPYGWQLRTIIDIIDALESIDVQDNNVIQHVISGAYGVGKTIFLSAFILVHLYNFGYLRPKERYKGVVLSGSLHQLKYTLKADIKYMLFHSNFRHYIGYTENHLYLLRDAKRLGDDVSNMAHVAFAVCNSGNTHTLSGAHADNILAIFDEGSAIHDAAYEKCENYFTSGRGCWVVAGNPVRNVSEGQTQVYTSFRRLFDDVNFSFEHVSRADFWGDDDAFSSRIADKYGVDSDEYRVKVLGQFPLSDSSAVFTQLILDTCVERGRFLQGHYSYLQEKKPVVVSVDVALGSSDCDTVIMVRDFKAVRLIHVTREGMEDLPNRIISIAMQYDTKMITIDAIGVGAGLVALVKNALTRVLLKPKVVAVVSSKQADQSAFANMRAQMVMEARAWCDTTGAFLPGENVLRLREELAKINYDEQARLRDDRVKIAPKQGSMDVADAFIYSFYDPDMLLRFETGAFYGHRQQPSTIY